MKRCFNVITAYGNRARVEKFSPEVHVFAGEYEGYKAYAEACGIAVIEHPRSHWQAVGRALPVDALFCLSQPSTIDAIPWPHANEFLALLAAAEKPRVLLDVTYVGSIAEAPAARIAADSPAVQAVRLACQNLSGLITTASAACCAGTRCRACSCNQWFKNCTSLQLGLTLLEAPQRAPNLPRRYKTVQREAAIQVGQRLGYAPALRRHRAGQIKSRKPPPTTRLRISCVARPAIPMHVCGCA